jgi:pyruvate-ferredoxin/flavodoxin oxidoreductase
VLDRAARRHGAAQHPLAPSEVWDALPRECRSARRAALQAVRDRRLRVAERAGLGRRINTVMQVCFFALSGVLPRDEAIAHIKASDREDLRQEGRRRGRARNFAAVDAALATCTR